MKKNFHMLIVGGDVRQIEVAKIFSKKGAKVSLVGFTQVVDDSIEKIKCGIQEIDFSQVDAILVPVSGIDHEGKVEARYSDGEIALTKDHLENTPEHCVIYTGIKTPYLTNLMETTGRKVIPMFARDDMAILNSIPTAEGTLKVAIEHTDFMIHGSNVMVLGYGRVGKTIARLFDAVGAKVRVGARKEADLARIIEVGLTPFHLKNLAPVMENVDICINTIPHLILTADILDKMAQHTLIIDVASKPGGTDFEYAKEKGLKALLELGIPGKVAPKSAGAIIAKVLVELLEAELN
ncbi:dipicolinic acid synthetase subunit A [Mesobacillus maritimus]|uniref:dipicolinic acid synthetase subunit A n=1 Tax=Mesobacillus maritimus TaxID=1643336 RepID=UPI00384EB45D